MNSLQNLVNIREEANRPILAPRIRRGGGGGSTPYSPSKKKTPYFHTKRQCSKISAIFWGKSYITIYTTASTVTQKKANWNNPEKKSSLSQCSVKIIWDWCEEPERSISSAPKTRLSISQLFGTVINNTKEKNFWQILFGRVFCCFDCIRNIQTNFKNSKQNTIVGSVINGLELGKEANIEGKRTGKKQQSILLSAGSLPIMTLSRVSFLKRIIKQPEDSSYFLIYCS